MVRIIETHKLGEAPITAQDEYWAYNGLDCCVTLEVFQSMPFASYAQATYDFERSLQGPALHMMQRGFPVNQPLMTYLHDRLMSQREKVRRQFAEITEAAFGTAISISSPAQLKELFYERLRLPPIYQTNKITRERSLTTDREALERLENYFYAKPFARHILAFRDVDKRKDVLRCELHEGRFQTSYNVAGTETGRWSSSSNAFGRGTNLQNVEPALRIIFQAPPGKKFAYIDGEQAESRLVGLLCWLHLGKDGYLNACESGDLHTTVTRMVWRDMAWTGDIKRDRPIAEQPFYRHFSYRDMAKRGGHGTNYYGQPFTMAKHLKVEKPLVEDFQHTYFTAFPEIREWHHWTAAQLQTVGFLDTPFARRRYFLGRRFDDATLREAIAHVPQSAIADVTNTGLLNIWKREEELKVQLLHQNHDAVVVMFDEERENEVLPELKRLMEYTFEIKGRKIVIPADAETGWNWCKTDEEGLLSLGIRENPDGMKRWRGGDNRKRTETIVYC